MCVVREDEHGAEITQLYVDGEYRYRGVGGRIVRSVLRLQRQRGVKQCITFAVGSSHFYKKVGFRKRKCKDNEGSERCEMFIDLWSKVQSEKTFSFGRTRFIRKLTISN